MRYLLFLPMAVALLTAQTEPELVLSVGHAGAPDRAVFAGSDLATSSWSNVALIDLRTGIVVAHLPQGSLVTALEASPRGEVLAVATCSDGVNLWDVKARRLIGRVAEGRECPDGLAFNSDGTLLAVANYQCCSTRHGLEVWDVRSRTLARDLTGLTAVRSAVFAGDDRWLAAVNDEEKATFFEWPSGRELRTYERVGRPTGDLSHALASRDGRYMAWVGGSGLRVFDVMTGREVPLTGARTVRIQDSADDASSRERIEQQVGAETAAFLDDGRLAYVDGDELNTLRLPAGAPRAQSLPAAEFDGHGDVAIAKPQRWLTIRRDGRLLAGHRDAQTVTFDVPGNRIRELSAAPLISPTSLRWSRSGLIALAGFHSGIRAWSDRAGRPVNLGSPTDSASGLAFDGDGSRLVVTRYGEVAVLDPKTRRTTATRDVEPKGDGVAVSADGLRLAFATGADGFALFDPALRTVRRVAALDPSTNVEHAAFSPDGNWIAAALEGPAPALLVWPTHQPAAEVALDRTSVTYGPQPPAFSSDSRRLASFSRGDRLQVWSTGSWREERTWLLPDTGRALGFAPDGSRLAIATDAGVSIWDAATGTHMVTFGKAGSDDVRHVAWSPSGDRVATVADDGVLRFWNAANGSLIASVYIFASGNDWLIITPDGRLDGSGRALSRSVAWRTGDRVEFNGAMTRRRRTTGLWSALTSRSR